MSSDPANLLTYLDDVTTNTDSVFALKFSCVDLSVDIEGCQIPTASPTDERKNGAGTSTILDMGFDSSGKMEVSEKNLFVLDLSYKMDEPDGEELTSFSSLNNQLLPKCGFQLLRILILRNNRLTNLSEMHLREMSCLTDIDLAQNHLMGTVPIGVFPSTLQRLDLSGNYLEGIAGLICCPSLLRLDVSSNSLRAISALPPRLEELDISHNKLSSINNLRLLSMSPAITSLNVTGNPAVEPYAPFRVIVCSLLLKLEKLDGVLLPGHKMKKHKNLVKKTAEVETSSKIGMTKQQQEEADILRHEEYFRRQTEVKEKRAKINENIDRLVRSPAPSCLPSPSSVGGSEMSPRERAATVRLNSTGSPIPKMAGFGAMIKKQQQEESDLARHGTHAEKLRTLQLKGESINREIDLRCNSPRSGHNSDRRSASPSPTHSHADQLESDRQRHNEHKRREVAVSEKRDQIDRDINSLCNSPRSSNASPSPTRREQEISDAARHDRHVLQQLESIVKRSEINEAFDTLSQSSRNRSHSPSLSPSRHDQEKSDKERAEAYLNKESLIQGRLELLQNEIKLQTPPGGKGKARNKDRESSKSVVSRNSTTTSSQKSPKGTKSSSSVKLRQSPKASSPDPTKLFPSSTSHSPSNKGNANGAKVSSVRSPTAMCSALDPSPSLQLTPTALAGVGAGKGVGNGGVTITPTVTVTPQISIYTDGSVGGSAGKGAGVDASPTAKEGSSKGVVPSTSTLRSGGIDRAMNMVNEGTSRSRSRSRSDSGQAPAVTPISSKVETHVADPGSRDSADCESFLDSESEITCHPFARGLSSQMDSGKDIDTFPSGYGVAGREGEGEGDNDSMTVTQRNGDDDDDGTVDENMFIVERKVIAEVEAVIEKNNDLLYRIVHEIRRSMDNKTVKAGKVRDKKKRRESAGEYESSICHSKPLSFPEREREREPAAVSSRFESGHTRPASISTSTSYLEPTRKCREVNQSSDSYDGRGGERGSFERKGPRRPSIGTNNNIINNSGSSTIAHSGSTSASVGGVFGSKGRDSYDSMYGIGNGSGEGKTRSQNKRQADLRALESSVANITHSLAAASVASWADASDVSSLAAQRSSRQNKVTSSSTRKSPRHLDRSDSILTSPTLDDTYDCDPVTDRDLNPLHSSVPKGNMSIGAVTSAHMNMVSKTAAAAAAAAKQSKDYGVAGGGGPALGPNGSTISNSNINSNGRSQSRRGSIENHAKPPVSGKVSSTTAAAASNSSGGTGAGVSSVYNTTTSSSRAKRSNSIDPFTALLLSKDISNGVGGGGGGSGNEGVGMSNPMHYNATSNPARSAAKDHETDREREKVSKGKDNGNERERVKKWSTESQPRHINGGVRKSDPTAGTPSKIVKGGHKESKEYLKMAHTEAPRLSDLEAMKQAEIDDCVEWVKRASELMHTQQLPSPPCRTSQSQSAPSFPPVPAPLSVSDSTTSTSSPPLSLTLSITPRGKAVVQPNDQQQQAGAQTSPKSTSTDHMREIDAAARYMKSQITARQMIETNDDSYENLARSFSLESFKADKKGDKKQGQGSISRDKVKGPSATIIVGASGTQNVTAAKKEKAVQSRGASVKEGKSANTHVEVDVNDDMDPSRVVQLEAIIAYFREQAEAKPGEPTAQTPFPFTFPATLSSDPTAPSSLPLPLPVPLARVGDIRQMSPISATQVTHSALLSSGSASNAVPTHISTPLLHSSVIPSSIHQADTSPGKVPVSIQGPSSSSSRPLSATRVTPHDPIPLTSVIPPPRHPSPAPAHAKSHKVLQPSELPFPKSPKSLSRSPLPRTTIASLILQATPGTRPAARSRNSNSISPPLKSLNSSSPPSRSPAVMTKAGRSSKDTDSQTGRGIDRDRDSAKALPVPTNLFAEKPHIESFFKTDRSHPTDNGTKRERERGEERDVEKDKTMHSDREIESEKDKEMEIAMNESQLISLLSSYDSLPISQLASVVRGIMSETTQTRTRPSSIPVPHVTQDPSTSRHTQDIPSKSSSKVSSQRTSDPTRSTDYIPPKPKAQGPSHPPVPAPAPVPVLVRAKTPDKERKSRLSINTAVTRGPELIGPGSATGTGTGAHVAVTAKTSQVTNTQPRPFVSSTNVHRTQGTATAQSQSQNLHKAWKTDSRTSRETKVVQKRVKEINEECKRVKPIISKKADIWDGKISSSEITMERQVPKQPLEKRVYLKRKSAVPLIAAVKSPPRPTTSNPNPNMASTSSSNPATALSVGVVPKSPLLERRAFKGGDIDPFVKSPEVSGDIVIIGSADSSLFRPLWNDDTHVEVMQQPFPPVIVVSRSRSPPRTRGEGMGTGDAVRASGITPPKQWGVKDKSRDRDSEKGKERERECEREREREKENDQSIDVVKSTNDNASVGASMSMRSGDTIPTKLDLTQTQAPTQRVNQRKAALEVKLKKKMEELDLVVSTWNDSMVSGDCGTVSVDHFDALSITDSVCSTFCDSTLRSVTDTDNASTAVARKSVRGNVVESLRGPDVADTKVVSSASASNRNEVEASSGEVEKNKSEVVVVEKDVRFMSMREKLELKLKMCEDEEIKLN